MSNTPKLIHFGLDDLIESFTDRICHALAIKLYHEHHYSDGWELVEVYRPQTEYPFHVMVRRHSPVTGELEYIDVRGIYTDVDYIFEKAIVARGHVVYLSEKQLQEYQRQEILSDLSEGDFRYAREPFAKIEELLPKIDEARPIDSDADEIQGSQLIG